MKRSIWMLLMIGLCFAMPYTSPVRLYAQGCTPVQGSGTVVSEDRTVTAFSAITFTDVGTLIVQQGATEAISVTADDNLVPLMETTVDGTTLILGLADGNCVYRATELTYTITVDDLQKLTVEGSGRVELQEFAGTSLEIVIDGAASVKASGAVENLDLTISGAGSFSGSELTSEAVDVTITGVGSATVNATTTLNVVIDGSGVVSYLGDPQVTQQITGFGLVRRVGATPGALHGSHKRASHYLVGPTQELTYTIKLHNSSAISVTAEVSDPIPEELNYVAGSASNNGTLNGTTLNWNGITVPAGEDVALTFRVTPAITVTRPTVVRNTATITSSGSAINRSTSIVLVPESQSDPEPTPTLSVENVVIGTGDLVTSRDVTIATTVSGEPINMYVREWYLNTEGLPRWQVVQESGWISFETSLDWELTEQGGTHYIGVWVEDAEGNRSALTSDAADFVSLAVPDELAEGGFNAYLVAYPVALEVAATLTTSAGDADLYVWEPGRIGLPSYSSTETGTATDTVSFETERAGTYIFIVYGAEESSYSFTIAPGGGPEQNRNNVATLQAKQLAFSSEPALSVAGQDPLNDTSEPAADYSAYLPLVVR
jgi:uncharacterized repeat protein (TIGR01451 family)